MDAVNVCKGEGGMLVMEKSVEIHNYVKTHYGVGRMWVGVSDRDAEGVYKFVDGTIVTTTFWGPSDPNGGSGANCVATNWMNNMMYDWVDESCTGSFPFLCQTSHSG